MIAFRGVSFSYPGQRDGDSALLRVDFDVRPGERVAVVGANGSGKSTLARLTDGLLLPREGSVTVDGLDTRDAESAWDVRARVGLVMQNPDNQIVGTIVEEDVAFGPENLGVERAEIRRRVDGALAAVGLTGLEAREPHLLSGGQKQRLAVAGALALEPAYLVLDEPTAMLDPEGRAGVLAVIEAVTARGVGVLHITHDLAEAAPAARVVALEAGRVAFDGPPAGLLGDPAALARLGLALPPIGVLAAELRRGGAPVPATVLDAESVVDALWR